MPAPPEYASLRLCVLAVSVLYDVDVVPHDDGFLLGDARGPLARWDWLARAVGACPPDGSLARRRLHTWITLRERIATGGPPFLEHLRATARLVALPTDHVEHPGPAWVRERLPGGALDLGLGVLGVFDDPDVVTVLPPEVFGTEPADEDPSACWWPDVRAHAERMGELAALRLARDDHYRRVLRPVGWCDVLSLLSSKPLREFLARSDGSGMRALAAPMRSRAWFDLRRIDPAYVAAAWMATDEFDRGVSRPLLVTTEEVAIAVAGGDPVRQCLQTGQPTVVRDRRRSRDQHLRRGFPDSTIGQ